MLCGLAEPTGGKIRLFENDALEEQRKRIGCTIETPAIYDCGGKFGSVPQINVYPKFQLFQAIDADAELSATFSKMQEIYVFSQRDILSPV